MLNVKALLKKICNSIDGKEDRLYVLDATRDNISISAGSILSPAIDCTIDGYEFVTPLYFNCSNASSSGQNVSGVTSYGMYRDENETTVKLYNRASGTAKIKVTITGLYRK